jgi:hypothetical protein
MTLFTHVPDGLVGRGIELPRRARGFAISLDSAEPWGGGRVEGRVEAREGRRGPQPVSVGVRCVASWLDLPPQLVGQKPFLRFDTYWELRTRAPAIWIDEDVWLAREVIGDLGEANWRPFAMRIPPELPRAFEGTFMAFRWQVVASRPGRIGRETASVPLLLVEPPTRPVVRIETSPIGCWRLLEWSSPDEREGSGGPCSVAYDERRPEDMPLPGEDREAETRRRRAG